MKTVIEEPENLRNQVKSRSLENLSSLSLGKNEKSATSLSPGSTLRDLRKKLALKLSKSNQDVGNAAAIEDGKKLSHGSLSAQFISSSVGMERRSRDEKGRSSLKIDARKRSKTTENINNGHPVLCYQDSSSSQHNSSDAVSGRTRSFTLDSNDQFVVVDNISVDESVEYDGLDEADGGAPDNERACQEIEKLKSKINKSKQQLLEMQNMKAENVQEFLESPKDQKNFEKRLQKIDANIQLFQRKIDKNQKMLKEYEERGVGQHRAKEMFRGMHDAVKAGASSISEVVSKPLESMNKLIKKERRSGSSDNISKTTNTGDTVSINTDEVENSYFASCSDDDTSSISSSNNQLLNMSGSINAAPSHKPSVASDLDKYQNHNNEISMLRRENEELKDMVSKLKEQLSFVMSTAEDERFRYEELERQLRDLFNQYNDLTELHQQEVMEVKEELYKAADRIECVDYRSAERAGEIEEALDSCVTRINRMELQQQHQQQLLSSVDRYFDGSGTAKLLLSKLLSLVISLFAIILVLVSMFARIISPFTSTWKRIITTLSFLVVAFLLWRNVDIPVMKLLSERTL